MAKKHTHKKQNQPKKMSKRDKRNKLIVYLMIAAMVFSALTAGLAFII